MQAPRNQNVYTSTSIAIVGPRFFNIPNDLDGVFDGRQYVDIRLGESRHESGPRRRYLFLRRELRRPSLDDRIRSEI